MKMTKLVLTVSCLVCAAGDGAASTADSRDFRPGLWGRPAQGVEPAPAPAPAPAAPGPGDKTITPTASGRRVIGHQEIPAGRVGPPNCEEVRRKARYNVYFDKVEIEKLVQTVSDATCKTFILPENVRGKISIIGPENGRVEVDGEQFYAAFLAALDANSLALYPHGKFLKIVDKQRAKQFPIPTVLDPTEQYSTNEQMMTRMFKGEVRRDRGPARRAAAAGLSVGRHDSVSARRTIIVNDLGSNMKRLERNASSNSIRDLKSGV